MRRLIPVLAVLALLLPALAVPASAEYVNHVGCYENTSTTACHIYTNVASQPFSNFSMRLYIDYGGVIKVRITDSDGYSFIYFEIDYDHNEVNFYDKNSDQEHTVGSAAIISPVWVSLYANTTYMRLGPYEYNISPLNYSAKKIDIWVTQGKIYFDDVMLNGELVEDFEDNNNCFSGGDIVLDPSPIIIHSPDWGDTVTVPFTINYTNPSDAVENEIIVDYTTIATVSNVTENVSFEFNVQDIPPGWHTVTIKAYNETGAEIGSTSIYLYVINENYVPPEGDNSTASGSSGNSSGDSGSSSSTGGSTGSSGSAGDTGDSGFTEFADDVKTWFETETLNIPRWIWILTIVGVLLIGSGVRRL